ncbi:hypothetical protein [Kineosporia babensis]
MTYIPTGQGWVFLATVIDCCTKTCIGYTLADGGSPETVDRGLSSLGCACQGLFVADGAEPSCSRVTTSMIETSGSMCQLQ